MDLHKYTKLPGISQGSRIKKTTGDVKPKKKGVEEKNAENTTRNINTDESKWNREEILERIKDTKAVMHKQQTYLQLQEEKQQRNKALLDHLTTLSDNDRKKNESKRRKCERLERQNARYDDTLHNYVRQVQTSATARDMAKRLHDDLTENKDALEKRRDLLRHQQRERGIDDDAHTEYINVQHALIRERERKGNLMKKQMWYKQELTKVNAVNNQGKLIENTFETRTNTRVILPEITGNKFNLVSQRSDVEYRKDNNTGSQRGGDGNGLDEIDWKPRPPEEPRSDSGIVARFRRKFNSRS